VSTSDLIQLGVLITYVIIALGTIIGGVFALLRYTRIVQDIEDRQKRIDEAGERNIRLITDLTQKAQTMATQNKLALIGLCICVGLLLIVDRLRIKPK